jgi:hypothetical protein
MGAASMDKSGGSVIAMITSPRRRIQRASRQPESSEPSGRDAMHFHTPHALARRQSRVRVVVQLARTQHVHLESAHCERLRQIRQHLTGGGFIRMEIAV